VTVERARVGDVVEPARELVSPDPLKEYVTIGVRSFGKGIFHYEPKMGHDLGSLRFYEVRADRLVVSNIKGWEGAIAVSSTADDGCLASNRFLQYVPRDDRVDVRWLRWYLLSEPGIELVQRGSPGSADRNRTLAIDRFEALEIPLPPIGEQREVAARLDRLHSGVAVNIGPTLSGSIGRLDALGVSGLREIAMKLRDKSPEVARLGEVGHWSSGGTPSAKNPAYYDGGIPWAVIGDLNDSVVTDTARTLTEDGLSGSAAKLVPPGTVLVAMYGSIGKLGLTGIEMATNQAIACCIPNAEILSAKFLMAYLRCIRVDLIDLGQGGAQQNISQSLLRSVPLPVPPQNAQDRFATRVEDALQQLDMTREALRRRNELAAAMLPSALNEAFAGLS
jgi:type I restriction enzyme S subunit